MNFEKAVAVRLVTTSSRGGRLTFTASHSLSKASHSMLNALAIFIFRFMSRGGFAEASMRSTCRTDFKPNFGARSTGPHSLPTIFQ